MPIIIDPGLAAVPAIQDIHSQLRFRPGQDSRQAKASRDAEATGPRWPRLAILNLMPDKAAAEEQLLRCLAAAATSRTLDIHFCHLDSHVSRHVAPAYLEACYQPASRLFATEAPEALIVTGAPVEHLGYLELDYWPQLCSILDWAYRQAKASLYLCWAAQAALWYRYSLERYCLEQKLSGVYMQDCLAPDCDMMRGLEDGFPMPHSRYTGIDLTGLAAITELELLVSAPATGASVIQGRGGRELYISGHPEYTAATLDSEYRRDLGRGLDCRPPVHYYPDDNPERQPANTWSEAGHRLFANWLNRIPLHDGETTA